MDRPVVILDCSQNGFLAVQSGEIDKIPVRKEGIKLVIGLTHLFSGKNQQKRGGFHLIIEGLAIGGMKGCLHGNHSLSEKL